MIHPSIPHTRQANKFGTDGSDRNFSAQLATLFGAANHIKLGDEFLALEITLFQILYAVSRGS
jgi:hypothetical protein